MDNFHAIKAALADSCKPKMAAAADSCPWGGWRITQGRAREKKEMSEWPDDGLNKMNLSVWHPGASRLEPSQNQSAPKRPETVV
jgi:hypothetical protein